MDAVDFLKASKRMCKHHIENCLCCPLVRFNTDDTLFCNLVYNSLQNEKNTDYIVKVVETWANQNPEKTMLQDFLEKYPKAILDTSNKTPLNICPTDLGYTDRKLCAGGICNSVTCEKCWNQPLKE